MSTLLEAKNICKYFGGLKAVEMVNMQISEGDIFGIIGPNGAGKTTFFNICSGIYKPTKGNVWFAGEEITALAPEKIARKGMARTFQNIQMFKFLTVLDNVKTGFHIQTQSNMLDAMLKTRRYHREELEVTEKSLAILEKVGLSKYQDTLAGNLAYGIQRKVEIARALALNPKILLLDEPAAGMNPIETQELSEFIKQLNRDGYTITVIEHDMKFVMSTCSRILVLNFGQKICEGTPDEVKTNQGVIEAYFGKGTLSGGGKANA